MTTVIRFNAKDLANVDVKGGLVVSAWLVPPEGSEQAPLLLEDGSVVDTTPLRAPFDASGVATLTLIQSRLLPRDWTYTFSIIGSRDGEPVEYFFRGQVVPQSEEGDEPRPFDTIVGQFDAGTVPEHVALTQAQVRALLNQAGLHAVLDDGSVEQEKLAQAVQDKIESSAIAQTLNESGRVVTIDAHNGDRGEFTLPGRTFEEADKTKYDAYESRLDHLEAVEEAEFVNSVLVDRQRVVVSTRNRSIALGGARVPDDETGRLISILVTAVGVPNGTSQVTLASLLALPKVAGDNQPIGPTNALVVMRPGSSDRYFIGVDTQGDLFFGSDTADTYFVTIVDRLPGTSDKHVRDTAGGMFDGNTETGITSTYDEASGKVNLAVTAASAAVATGATISGDGEAASPLQNRGRRSLSALPAIGDFADGDRVLVGVIDYERLESNAARNVLTGVLGTDTQNNLEFRETNVGAITIDRAETGANPVRYGLPRTGPQAVSVADRPSHILIKFDDHDTRFVSEDVLTYTSGLNNMADWTYAGGSVRFSDMTDSLSKSGDTFTVQVFASDADGAQGDPIHIQPAAPKWVPVARAGAAPVQTGADASDATPLPEADTGAPGSSADYSRGDHVHPRVAPSEQEVYDQVRNILQRAGRVTLSRVDGTRRITIDVEEPSAPHVTSLIDGPGAGLTSGGGAHATGPFTLFSPAFDLNANPHGIVTLEAVVRLVASGTGSSTVGFDTNTADPLRVESFSHFTTAQRLLALSNWDAAQLNGIEMGAIRVRNGSALLGTYRIYLARNTAGSLGYVEVYRRASGSIQLQFTNDLEASFIPNDAPATRGFLEDHVLQTDQTLALVAAGSWTSWTNIRNVDHTITAAQAGRVTAALGVIAESASSASGADRIYMQTRVFCNRANGTREILTHRLDYMRNADNFGSTGFNDTTRRAEVESDFKDNAATGDRYRLQVRFIQQVTTTRNVTLEARRDAAYRDAQGDPVPLAEQHEGCHLALAALP